MSTGSSSRNLRATPAQTKREAGAQVTWGPMAAILVVVLGFGLGQFFGGLLISLIPVLAGWSALETDAWFSSTAGQFTFVVLSEAFTVLILWLFLRRRRAGLAALGFGRGSGMRDIAYVLLGMVVYFILFVVVSTMAGIVLGVNLEQEQEIGFEQVIGAGGLLMVFVSLVVLPPIVEEVLFRGFLYSGLRTKLGIAVAALITSTLFAIPHLFASTEGLLWIAGIDTFILSLVLCYLREKTGALWAPIGLHALKNGLAFVYLFVVA